MAKRDILIYPDPKLTEKSLRVDIQKDDIADLVKDLVETMVAYGGAGLSAIQVGVPLRIFVVRNPEGDDKSTVMVNPDWKPVTDAETGDYTLFPVKEGCLSFPAFFEEVERYNEVEAHWLGPDGVEYTRTFKGIEAQVIQHESEHLDGKLLSDNLSFTKLNKLKTHMKQYARRPQETLLLSMGINPRALRNFRASSARKAA